MQKSFVSLKTGSENHTNRKKGGFCTEKNSAAGLKGQSIEIYTELTQIFQLLQKMSDLLEQNKEMRQKDKNSKTDFETLDFWTLGVSQRKLLKNKQKNIRVLLKSILKRSHTYSSTPLGFFMGSLSDWLDF